MLFFCVSAFDEFEIPALIAFVVTVVGLIIYVAISRTEISFSNNSMVMSDFRKRLELRDVENIETWWSYDFQASSPEMSGEGGTGKSVGMANKIKIFAKISAKNEVGFLYEQIYLSDKFPNNHTYSYNASVDKERLFKVWDLDKCLSQLKLIST